jgi:cellulose synthase/poly-beta-1,6-N-acetylglucosamine synthase-like glycosyltransferase
MSDMGRALLLLSLAFIATALCYNGVLFALSRRRIRVGKPRHSDRFYVFLLACLNEEKVLAASLDRILSLPGDNYAALVIDDASDDATAAIVQRVESERIWLHRRKLPDARRGKGAALNDGLRVLRSSALVAHRDPRDVIVCVVDADGRLDADVLAQVDPYFDDSGAGAVQICVRMYNRATKLLTRLQDMEFVTYTDIFQAGRRHLGSVGLGGNGQFMRLSALDSLDGDPWSDCLTEDLDLGIRLLAAGWSNRYCDTTAVHQQAIVDVPRLVRQRSRWFQGHMQASRLVPLILRRIPSGRAAADLLYHLFSPLLILTASLLPMSLVLTLVAAAIGSLGTGQDLFDVAWLPWMYALSFGVGNIYGYVYWRRDREVGLLRSLLLGHAFVLYGYLWFFAGWWAVGRTIRGQNSWLKTAHT